MTIEIGKLACWRRSPTGTWLIWGRFDILMESLDGGDPVQVRSKAGSVTEVHIERVTEPNSEGYSYGWPIGTVTGEFSEPVQVPTVRTRRPKPRVRRHGGLQRNQRRRDRMR